MACISPPYAVTQLGRRLLGEGDGGDVGQLRAPTDNQGEDAID
jgi:hypothetical protein